MLELVSNNKEWVFSGIGVPLVSGLTIWMWRQFLLSAKSAKVTPILENTVPREESSRKPTESEMIAGRFKQVLDLLNEGRQYEPFTIAKLAQIMKLNKVGELEDSREL